MNQFIHYTCDNIDILDETLDGKYIFHATQMAAWQQMLLCRCFSHLPGVPSLSPISLGSCILSEHTVITVDEALYCRFMELKWSVPEYQEKLIPRLDGLHISMNFIKAIGQHMGGSELAEVWLESGLLGQGAVELVLAGKAYNKYMRAHKLPLQPLWRILVPTFLPFLTESNNDYHTELFILVNDETPERIPELVSLLMQERVRNLLAAFIESKSEDVNFIFWWQYMDMVSILLLFTRAQRDGMWDLYLHSFSQMLPYFKWYDHLNYAR
ncbi:hypothetical protein PR048_005592 [Dryococelus australis]|uniref:Uncharacterized protein n=1 Tax=Dryococelus australis TaxID=614101 RepID=A0ABQ9I8S7_9NEOP|nr:hypothetical protein PR048_005592 [Dryococelus australis]